MESQFRLTYSMILNLLRVEQLRVEDMMKRSFSEFHHQKDVSKHKVTIDQLHKQIAQIRPIECYLCSVDLEKYHESCRDYQCLRRKLQVGRTTVEWLNDREGVGQSNIGCFFLFLRR